MAANDFVLAYQPVLTGMVAVKNTDGVNINSGDLVKMDVANPLSATVPFLCVVRAGAVTDSPVFVAIDNILQLKSGRVAVAGPIARCVASAAIVVNAAVTATAAGQAVTKGAGNPQFGWALTPAANAGDQILVLMTSAANA